MTDDVGQYFSASNRQQTPQYTSSCDGHQHWYYYFYTQQTLMENQTASGTEVMLMDNSSCVSVSVTVIVGANVVPTSELIIGVLHMVDVLSKTTQSNSCSHL